MGYGELNIDAERPTRNAVTGRFLKGNTPHNKGKKWSDYMGKRAIKRASKGWQNLIIHRSQNNGGQNKKGVIAVSDQGQWLYFVSVHQASEWLGGSRENVGRCCRFNESGKILKKGKNKGKTNTDNKYKGVRFYFETNPVWTTKINENGNQG